MVSVVDSLPEHIAVVDREGWIVAVNDAWKRFARDNGGAAERCNEGVNYLAVCREASGRATERAAETGQRLSALLAGDSDGFSLEYPCHSPTRNRWFLLYAAPLRGGEGGAVLSHIEITARVRAERSLRQREAELRQVNEALQQQTRQAERRSEQLQKLTAQLFEAEQRERRRIAQLLHDHLQQVLVAAKMRAGTLAGVDAQTHSRLTELMDEAINASRNLSQELCPPVLYDRGLTAALRWLARRFGEQHRIAIEVEAAPDAAPHDPDFQAFLFQAIRELLLNAVKHGGADRVRVEMHRSEGMLTISVTDNGAGCVPEKMLQGDAGEGFGLFSIQERLNLLGGSMSVRGAPGEGCRVTLRLSAAGAAGAAGEGNRKPASTEAAHRPDKPRPETTTAGTGEEPTDANRPIRVMLVDDHRIVRDGLAGILRAEPDLELVAEASDGREAVERVERERPDVIVMDVSMPRMDGVEATRVILRDHPEIRVIGLSMHEREDLAEAMRTAGAAAYLSKQSASTELVGAIHEHAGQK